MKKDGMRILKKSDASMFFATLAHNMRLVGPKRYSGGDVMFGPLDSPKDIVWDYGHDMYPLKHYLLPQYEDMFAYKAYRSIEIKSLMKQEPTAIIGIRSCDVMAVRFQEKFFSAQIVDPYYKSRAENTVLFSLACNRPPKKECFCICCDAGPYLTQGFDVQLTDLGDRFLYEVGSEKGEKATDPDAYMLTPASSADLAELNRIRHDADLHFETEAYFAKAINFISYHEVPEALWEKLGFDCFRCGACTNLCPVCTCFTVNDRAESDGTFVRCRSWDSCQYAGFTREASGHNPRETAGQRIQRRFFHKASYQYITRDGRHGCVGCGRCISACLGDLGVPTILKKIRRLMHDYGQPEDEKVEA